VREVEGPPGAPAVILLHGWMASGGLNWFQAFEPLGRHFRVIAPDLRGHGRGIRSRRRFRLADCADDVSALAHELGVTSAIVAGYSMGGPVAQLLWKRDPGLVDGLVMAATSDCFVRQARQRVVFATMMSIAAGTTGLTGLAMRIPVPMPGFPPVIVRSATARRREASIRRWAANEMRRHDWTTVLQAGQSIGTYDARGWTASIDVPVVSIITTSDSAITPAAQHTLAERVHADIIEVPAGHILCARPNFGTVMVDACQQVLARV
jgi:3-oxoadipate enol-lactonase